MKHNTAVKLYELMGLGETKTVTLDGKHLVHDISKIGQVMYTLDYPVYIPLKKPDPEITNSEYFKDQIAFLREWADALESDE